MGYIMPPKGIVEGASLLSEIEVPFILCEIKLLHNFGFRKDYPFSRRDK